MRCTATDSCLSQLSNPGVSEYDCPEATTIYSDLAPECLCPVCKPSRPGDEVEEQDESLDNEDVPQPNRGREDDPDDLGSVPGSSDSSTTRIASQTPPASAPNEHDAQVWQAGYIWGQLDNYVAQHRDRAAAYEDWLASLSRDELLNLLGGLDFEDEA